MSIFRRMLRLGGYLNIAIAAAHLFMMFMIVARKQIFQALGTPVLEKGWGLVRLQLMIAGVAAFVGLLGLYGLSGGGRIRKLPFLRAWLLLTGAIFIFRATEIIGNIQALAERGVSDWHSLTRPSVSLFALCIGLLYMVGTIGLWKRLQAPVRREHTQGVREA